MEGKLTEKDIRKVLTRCDLSDEMIEYLISENAVSSYQLADIISRAPVTLDEKMSIFDILGKKQNLKFDAFISIEDNMNRQESFEKVRNDFREIKDSEGNKTIWPELYNRRKAISEAMDFICRDLDYDKPLYLFAEWYDTDELRLKSEACGLFTTLDAVEDFIRKEEADNETGDGYYRVELWDTRDANCELPRYDYFYYKGRPCWFEQLIPEEQENGNKYYTPKDREFTTGLLDLDLKTPYCPGDIVLIDCRPFGPPFHAMILEARDQFDCCFPNIISCFLGTDKWHLTPLKHKRLYKDISWHTYEPMLSPLYRLRKAKNKELSEEDEKLLELSRLIAGSEEKAKIIWNKWEDDLQEGLSWNSVINIFNTTIRSFR